VPWIPSIYPLGMLAYIYPPWMKWEITWRLDDSEPRLALWQWLLLNPWRHEFSWATDFDPFFPVLARFGPSANVDIGIHWPQKSQKNNFKLYQSAFSSFFQLILHDLPDIYLIFTWYFYFQDSSQWPKKKPQLHLAGSFCEGPLQAARKALRRVSASFANRPDRAQGSLRSVRSLESIRIWQYISG
jgi:hypothetical protein